MNKVIIAFDGGNFSEGAFEFVRAWHEKKPFLLTGVFLSSVDYYTFLGYPIGFVSDFLMDVTEADNAATSKSIEKFKSLCEHNDIKYHVHEDLGGEALHELKKESRFADLLVVGSEKFYYKTSEKTPGTYLENVLHNSECPVLLVPERGSLPSKIILTYDSSESSVFAIKMFTYLFNDLYNRDTILVHMGKENDHLPDEEYIEELASQHFNNLNVLNLNTDQHQYIDKWLADKNDAILVAGAYGRSEVSEMFRKSFIANVIEKHKLLLFITHK